MKSVLFITHEGFLSTIFQSQVLEHCSYINKEFDNEIQIDVLTYEVFSSQYIESCKNLERFKSGSEYKESYKIFLEKGFNIYYPLSLFLNLYLLYKFLKEKNYSVIHARSNYTAFLCVLLRPVHRAKVVWDCRGDEYSELKQILKKKSKFVQLYGFYLLLFHRWAVFLTKNTVDKFLFVSQSLSDLHLKKTKNVNVIPCLVNRELFYFDEGLRAKYRHKLGFDNNDCVALYSGSVALYQGVTEVDRYFKRLLKKYSNIKICIVTPNSSISKEIFIECSAYSDRVLFLTLPFDEMNAIYNASDFGILLRNNDSINRVASPTKFGEYCMSGLPVIMNDSVAQAVEISKDIGNYVSADFAELGSVKKMDRVLISKNALSYFSRDFYRTRYFELYTNFNPK
jgi:hypothetical protein